MSSIPSVSDHLSDLQVGQSYAHFSEIPSAIQRNSTEGAGTPCVLGVDEAGRGPVIGPMVYGIFYLPMTQEKSLLADTHHFDDSKVLTPATRADLMQKVCTAGTDLYSTCGWAIKSLSARDIGAGMLKNGGAYNLNAQAMDATIEIIQEVLNRGVNVQEVYVDTIGIPAVYQKKLQHIFPAVKVTVEKKADSLFPCVSAASVVAKVTRDISCEMLFEHYREIENIQSTESEAGWGSGYPSDAKCVSWLKGAIDPVFGWGSECRFSWGTVKDLLEGKTQQVMSTDWPEDDDGDNLKVSQYFSVSGQGHKTDTEELRDWFGTRAGQEII